MTFLPFLLLRRTWLKVCPRLVLRSLVLKLDLSWKMADYKWLRFLAEDGRRGDEDDTDEALTTVIHQCHDILPWSSSSSSSSSSFHHSLPPSIAICSTGPASKVGHLHVGRCFRCWDAKQVEQLVIFDKIYWNIRSSQIILLGYI